MNIVILMGSPRLCGNTAELCKPFIEELKENGAKVRYVTLADKDIHSCKGCYTCQEIDGEYGCCQKDEMPVEDILWADMIVLATELGVQPASLYSHVKNFDELKVGIMNYGWKQLEHSMIQDIAGVSGYDAVRVMCRSFYSYAVQNPGIYRKKL